MSEPAEFPTTPQGKAELLERIHQAYAALEQTIGRLSDQQLIATPADGWSAKDILAHIAAWQQILLRFHIEKQPFSAAAPGIGVDYASSDVDTINDALYRRDRDRTLAEVLDTFRRSHQQMLAIIAGMSEAVLFDVYTPPGRDQSGQVIDWVAGDTYEHYMEHRETIEKLSGG
jgi:hypothetical protein